MENNQFICREDYPIVNTKYGKLRGYEWNHTIIFKGIKYADARRFQRPVETKPWKGIREANSYGMVCPLMEQEIPKVELMVPHMYWPMDENCQYLNIWTQDLNPKKGRPVMVWLHGGGYAAGSSIEQLAYDGENMSKYGDVVVVSLNHRLNVLGYLDLSCFGEKYEASANVGNFDIIAALQWIKENIHAFGGDPENITLFGQSGGGAKVWSLMQMPEADGLFHKGIIQSGVIETLYDVENDNGEDLVKAILKELDLDVSEIEKLETVPYYDLADAYQKVSVDFKKAGRYVGNHPHTNQDYLGDPMKYGFREHAKQIPLMVGTVFGEFDFGLPIAGKNKLTETDTKKLLRTYYGEDTDDIIRMFEQAYPGKHPVDVLSLDLFFRVPTIAFLKERCKTKESITYSYQFTYEFPLHDGKMAWHCSEIPFVFHNIEKVPICNHGPESEKLQKNLFYAWISFAYHGIPKVEEIEWPACTDGDEPTMIFDTNCEVRHNFDHALIKILQQHDRPELSLDDVQH